VRKNSVLYIILGTVSIGFAVQCTQSSKPILRPKLPEQAYDYSFPKGFTSKLITTEDNLDTTIPYTNDVVTLGRVLFYDKMLSANGQVSCGTCHKQEFGFADNTPTSAGFTGIFGKRNTPTLINIRFSKRLFWDERMTKLEDAVIDPIGSHIEMGFEKRESLPHRLELLDYYPPLFQKAFGASNIELDLIQKALAQFLRSLVSVNSRVDQSEVFKLGIPLPHILTQSEINGLAIMSDSRIRCLTCHALATKFGKGLSFNIGLDSVFSDLGFGERVAGFEGAFTAPSLRNLANTAPYMHDGRFATLREVLDHYCCNIKTTKQLSPQLRSGNASSSAIRMNFSEQDKQDIISFLLALSDDEVITHPKYSDPFK
jgi:cytochrome c peroxidase